MNDRAVFAQVEPSEAIVDRTAAFEDFFRDQTQRLYAHLCLITGNRAEAEELGQDAFLKIWERWDRVAEMDEQVGYLYRTAMNLFRKRYRRAVLALRKTVSAALRRDEFTTAEDRSVVAQALVGLAPRQRAALVLTELIGFSSGAASRMLGVSPGTVRVLASQGRAALKQHRGCLTHVRSWSARSPDGTRLAYSSVHTSRVYVVDVASGNAVQVSDGVRPVWLDDHTLIVKADRCLGPRSDGCGG